jgi:hypothetical protein
MYFQATGTRMNNDNASPKKYLNGIPAPNAMNRNIQKNMIAAPSSPCKWTRAIGIRACSAKRITCKKDESFPRIFNSFKCFEKEIKKPIFVNSLG